MYDRSTTIGASDAVYIAEGRWAELYDQKRNPSPDALSDVLPVQIGKATEGLNLTWFARESGHEYGCHTDPDKPYVNPNAKWCVALPDAIIEDPDGTLIPVECKHVNQFWNPTNLKAKYLPQLLHQMRVLGSPSCYLSVIYGNGTKYEYYRIEYDPIADAELERQEELFYWFLSNEQRPPE